MLILLAFILFAAAGFVLVSVIESIQETITKQNATVRAEAEISRADLEKNTRRYCA